MINANKERKTIEWEKLEPHPLLLVQWWILLSFLSYIY